MALFLRVRIICLVSPPATSLSRIASRSPLPRRYVFLYGVHYYMKNVHSPHYIAALLFFGYMAVVSFLFFVLTGASLRSALPPLPLMLSYLRVLRLRAHLLLCPLDFRSREVGLTRRFWIQI